MSGPEPTDEELLRAAGAGDPRAFETLYRRHRDWAAAVAGRYCRNDEDALDVLQETFFYLARRLPGLTLTGKLRTFLFPAIRHRSLDKVRARRPAPLDDALPIAAPEPREGSIDHLVAGLDDAERELLEMRFADGFSLEEIASALEIPLGTVKSRLHTALSRLRERLGRGPGAGLAAPEG